MTLLLSLYSMSLLCQLLFYAANSSKQALVVSDPSGTSNSCPHPPVVYQ